MFNLKGEVIGINTAIYSPSGGSVGIGFAIPANLAKPIIDQLNEFGRARRGWLGVRIQTVTEEIAESLGMKDPKGALVANVTPDGPAEKYGIKVGDVITDFDRRSITDMRELPRAVAETKVGKAVKVKILRQGKEKTILITLGEFPENDGVVASNSSSTSEVDKPSTVLGLELAKINSALRKKFEIEESVDGVIVVTVSEDSLAGQQGLLPGDIIRRVGRSQEAPSSGADVKKQVALARKGGEKTILFLIERAGNSRFVALQLQKRG